MYDVLALDAGLSTGWVRARVHDDGAVEILELHQEKAEDWRNHVLRLRQALIDADVLVYERFDLRPGNKFLADLTTVKINSAVEYLLVADPLLQHVEPVQQTPAQAKGLVSNAVLKQIGWWPTGKTVGAPDADDVRDALRHLVHYEVKAKRNKWLSEAGWPR